MSLRKILAEEGLDDEYDDRQKFRDKARTLVRSLGNSWASDLERWKSLRGNSRREYALDSLRDSVERTVKHHNGSSDLYELVEAVMSQLGARDPTY